MSDFVDKAEAWDALAKANARIVELEEALRPFALTYQAQNLATIKMADWNRAARALKDTDT